MSCHSIPTIGDTTWDVKLCNSLYPFCPRVVVKYPKPSKKRHIRVIVDKKYVPFPFLKGLVLLKREKVHIFYPL